MKERRRSVARSELVRLIQQRFPDLSIGEVAASVGVIVSTITSALERGERVELRGFGSFFNRCRSGQVARNPRTGESIFVKAHDIPSFRMSPKLGQALNSAQEPLGESS